LLENLVYLTHANPGGGDNEPLSDGGPNGDHGWSFGGGGHGGGAGGSDGGAGGGGGNSGSPGYEPSTDFLAFDSFPVGNGGKNGGDPLFLSPTIPPIAAVPEPATWALFILGFGIIGARLRHARDMRLAPALTRARGKRLG